MKASLVTGMIAAVLLASPSLGWACGGEVAFAAEPGDPNRLVTLRNGAREPEALVRSTFRLLASLYEDDPIAFNELFFAAEEPGRGILVASARETLRNVRLLNEADQMHASVRNIVLSSARGEGIFLELVNPVVDE